MRNCLLLLFIFLVGCSVPRYKPVGLGIPKKLNSSLALSAIKEGAQNSGWSISAFSPREYIARIAIGEGNANVKIIYDSNLEIVKFQHLNSTNLKENNRVIDFRYNLKLEQLEKAIGLALAGKIF